MTQHTILLKTHMKAVTDMREVNTRLRKEVKAAERRMEEMKKAILEARILIGGLIGSQETITPEIKAIAEAWMAQYGGEEK